MTLQPALRIPLLAIGFACAALPMPAAALLQLSADVGGIGFFCADQSACDTDPTVGILALGGGGTLVINGVQVRGSVHQSTKGILNILNSSSLEIFNNSGAARSIQVSVSDTDFIGPASLFSASGSGTWQQAAGSSIALSWFNDPNNAQGADDPNDTPGNLVHTFTDLASGLADSYSTTSGLSPLAFPDLGLFSMTLEFDIELIAGGRLISRGQTLLKPQQEVPEPASLLLVGAALLGVFGTRLKQRDA